MKRTLFVCVAIMLLDCLLSCSNKHEKAVESVITACKLIDSASYMEGKEFSVPMGLQLGCTESDIIKKCEELVMNSAGHQKDIPNTYRKQYFVKTKEFGNAEREVSIEYLCYNKDSNKPTSKIDKELTLNKLYNCALIYEQRITRITRFLNYC